MTSFIDQMRAKAEPGYLWRDAKHLAGAVLLFIWGVYGLSITTDSVAVSWLLLLGGLAWAAYVVYRYRARQDPAHHPLGLALAAIGERMTVTADVERDFTSRTLDALPLQVGKRFICFARKAQVLVLPLEQIMWAYPEVVRHSMNMIPTGRSHQLVLWKRDGSADNLPLAKADVEPCVARLREAAPWLPVGYSEPLKESWNADRAEFIAMVDAARVGKGA